MKPKTFMLIAGETSGDMLAAELVATLRTKSVKVDSRLTDDVQPLHTALAPKFFGAGGPLMAAAGVELAFDLTQHAIVGVVDVVKNYFKFRRLFQKLLKLAMERQPDVIICVDFSGFNRRLVHAVKQHIRTNRSAFNNWNPRLVQFVSPQVWASRPNRVYQVARDYDVVLSIFPFEKDWYARRVPKFRVEFVGHPMLNRFQPAEGGTRHAGLSAERILLLPGSRVSELRRHLGAMLGALKLIQAKRPACRAKMVLPDESLMRLAKSLGVPDSVEIQIGNLSQALRQADVAIASTGTVTMECAFFGVPTVTLYKLSWATYQVGRRIMTVKWFTMPNILANEEIYPEFLQSAATPENLASAALELLQNESRRAEIKTQLAQVVASLGGPGASERAAAAILGLLQPRT